MPSPTPRVRWLLVVGAVLAFVLVPFALVGTTADAAAEAWVRSLAERPWATAVGVAALLAADVVAPVPSSVVATLAGAALGVLGGALAAWLGLMAGCGIGYALGRGAAPRWLSDAEVARLETAWARWGDAAVVVARAVPVLAEASVVFAGMSAMPPRRFWALTALANAGVAVVYAAVGAWALDGPSFLVAVGVSMALPGVAMLLARGLGRASHGLARVGSGAGDPDEPSSEDPNTRPPSPNARSSGSSAGSSSRGPTRRPAP